MSNYSDPFGNLLRYLRVQAKIELWQAAELLDLTMTELYSWEQGVTRPDTNAIRKVSFVYPIDEHMFRALYTLWELPPLNAAAGPVWLAA